MAGAVCIYIQKEIRSLTVCERVGCETVMTALPVRTCRSTGRNEDD